MNFVFLSAYQKQISPLSIMSDKATQWIIKLTPIGDLILRCWVAYAFFISGLIKIQNWDSTVYLFNNEYAVPLLPPQLAAYLATATELCVPVLLAIGCCGRIAAGTLLVFNIAAVISYPDLGAAGIEQHAVWGIMLLVCLLHGPGTWSVDFAINRFFAARSQDAASGEHDGHYR